MFITSNNILQEVERQKRRKRNLLVITGGVDGLFFGSGLGRYGTFEEFVVAEFSRKYHVLSLDINTISILSDELLEDLEAQTPKASALGKKTKRSLSALLSRTPEPDSLAVALPELLQRIVDTDYEPIRAIELLSHLTDEAGSPELGLKKPVLVLVRNSGIIFPRKPVSDLQLDQAHRLQAFLNWMQQGFAETNNLVLLTAPIQTDLNESILKLPNASLIEVSLPDQVERQNFISYCFRTMGQGKGFGISENDLTRFTAGLSLFAIQDLFEDAIATNSNISIEAISVAINEELKARLGDIVSFEFPKHGPDDIVGYKAVKDVVGEVFDECKDPKTAHGMVLLVGPNGTGKTFIAEAFAKASSRFVVSLSRIRDSLFGGTERLFEQFRLVAQSFDNLLVMMDEADAVMGDVNDSQSHEVERRVTAGILKMASDKQYLGKLIWLLMTARPENLSSDVISRCSAIIPIFDLDGEERREFVEELFARADILIEGEELEKVVGLTTQFSNRDFGELVKKVIAKKKNDNGVRVSDILAVWQPGKAIQTRRIIQELVAAEHSTYPNLIPKRIKDAMTEEVK